MANNTNGSGAQPETNPHALKAYEAYADRLILLKHWKTLSAKGKPLGKTPFKDGWPDERNSFADAMDHMQRGFNVGFRLGDGWTVIDWDKGRDPACNDPTENSLARLCRDTQLDLSKCAIVETGNGLHVYLRTPPGWRGEEEIEAYPGIEFKGVGRYVVCAGSVHPSGKVYRWKQQ